MLQQSTKQQNRQKEGNQGKSTLPKRIRPIEGRNPVDLKNSTFVQRKKEHSPGSSMEKKGPSKWNLVGRFKAKLKELKVRPRTPDEKLLNERIGTFLNDCLDMAFAFVDALCRPFRAIRNTFYKALDWCDEMMERLKKNAEERNALVKQQDEIWKKHQRRFNS